MDYKLAEVIKGKYKNNKVIVIGEDKDVWNGKRWHEMDGNPASCNYAFRMGGSLVEEGIDAYKGITYACDLKGESILFHESELNIIRDATREDIRKNLEDGQDRIILNIKEE